jgi:hypothetical protein
MCAPLSAASGLKLGAQPLRCLRRVRSIASSRFMPRLGAGRPRGLPRHGVRVEGVVARLIRFEGATEAVEGQQARAYRELLPALEAMDGFRGLIILGAPERLEATLISLWRDDVAANQSEGAAEALRERTAGAGEVPLSVERFEVMLFEV